MESWANNKILHCFYLIVFAKVILAACPISRDIPPPICAFLFTDNECSNTFCAVTEDSQAMELNPMVVINYFSFFSLLKMINFYLDLSSIDAIEISFSTFSKYFKIHSERLQIKIINISCKMLPFFSGTIK